MTRNVMRTLFFSCRTKAVVRSRHQRGFHEERERTTAGSGTDSQRAPRNPDRRLVGSVLVLVASADTGCLSPGSCCCDSARPCLQVPSLLCCWWHQHRWHVLFSAHQRLAGVPAAVFPSRHPSIASSENLDMNDAERFRTRGHKRLLEPSVCSHENSIFSEV